MSQSTFGFFNEVRRYRRPAVLSYKPFNAGGWEGSRNKRVTYEQWLEWHYPLGNGGN